MISDNVEFLPPIFMPCFGSHFENGRHIVDGMDVYNKFQFSADNIDGCSLESLCQLDIQVC
jgi:hypothetical protein